MKKEKKEEKKKGIEIEFQEDPMIRSFGFDTGKGPIFLGIAGQQISDSFYRQKCREIFMSSKFIYEDAQRSYGNDSGKCIFIILNVNDLHGRMCAEIIMPAITRTTPMDISKPKIVATVVNKSWVLNSIPINIAIREKIRESGKMDVVVIDYGITEVIV